MGLPGFSRMRSPPCWCRTGLHAQPGRLRSSPPTRGILRESFTQSISAAAILHKATREATAKPLSLTVMAIQQPAQATMNRVIELPAGTEYRPPYIAAGIAALAVWLLYAFTLSPTTWFWDTSE